MRVVIALGGNALLKRGEPPTAEGQRANVELAAAAIAQVISAGHQVIVTHGNGPQVGLLALQSMAYDQDTAFPLDVLGAETEGMIGYMIEQELDNLLPDSHVLATLLTQVEVDPIDPAFGKPTKPIGPLYTKAEADKLAAARGWSTAPDGDRYRRVVPSPRPINILELRVIELLIAQNVTVICAGGGGIPVVRRPDGGLVGVEAVIDKDRASALLARQIRADALLMLTDVDGVYRGWGTPQQILIRRTTPDELKRESFEAGSMGPKVEAAIEFIETGGRIAAIGKLSDALEILNHRAGTCIGV
jgi:carbamate kinase